MAHGLDLVETGSGAASVPDTPPDRILAAINRIIVILSSVALVIAGFVLTYSVVVRYFLKYSTDWQDEMSVFLIVGAVFMSAAAIQAQRGHIGIEAIVGLLSKRANRVRLFLVDVASLLFCASSPGSRSPCCTRRSSTTITPRRHGRRRCGSPIR